LSRKVLLHVGTPKTGTSYLQDVLHHNRVRLAAQGVLYPAERFDAHFLAALDLLKMPWGGLEEEAVGAWDTLAGQVRRWPGTAIISHEIFAVASRTQTERAMQDLSANGAEVHLIISARDLVRQIPAEWQENIKHRRTFSYQRFLSMIADPRRRSRTASWFWGVQELPDILDRWGSSLPPERVHIVTVPRPGAPSTLLWDRFSEAFELGELGLDLTVDRANPSLGAPETALLRRINRAVNKDVRPADYRPLVRELLAHQTLSKRTSSPRLALPPEAHAWASALCESWVAELQERRYSVVGDLADLLPEPLADTSPTGFFDPDRPKERLVTNAALDAIRVLLLDNARLRDREADLARRLAETEEALHLSYLRPTYKMREKAVGKLEAAPWGRLAMKAYRRARGRNSRST
jgi:hypothetical protein